MLDIMKYVIITLILVFTFGFGGLFGVWFAQPDYQAPANVVPGYPTGEQVLDELNVYRQSIGLPPFELYEPLCNNIYERWKVYVGKESHEGIEEFHDMWMPQVIDLGEIMVAGSSAQEMVKKWSESPSHDILIRKYSRICVYSAQGSSVALLSN